MDSVFVRRGGAAARGRSSGRHARTVPRSAWIVCVLLAAPSSSYGRTRAISYRIITQNNLKVICTEWNLFDGHPYEDRSAFAAKLPRRLSAYSDQARWRDRVALGELLTSRVAVVGGGLAVLSAVCAFLAHDARRRVAIAGLLVAGGLVGIGVAGAGLAALVYPGDTAYLDDYDYLDWSWDRPADAGDILVAYEKSPLDPTHRVAAFGDGSVRAIRIEEFDRATLAPRHPNAPE